MQIIFFTSNFDIVNEWELNHKIENSITCYETQAVNKAVKNSPDFILIVDYDDIANKFNKILSSGVKLKNTIVLEKSPEIVTGKMLLSRGVSAYGNSRMLSIHYHQMIEAVIQSKVWTYPELTLALVKDTSSVDLDENSIELMQHRLSPQEIKVTYRIFEGLTNDAIALKLDITTRTVKAHITAIFRKLHVSDRISLVLLLK